MKHKSEYPRRIRMIHKGMCSEYDITCLGWLHGFTSTGLALIELDESDKLHDKNKIYTFGNHTWEFVK